MILTLFVLAFSSFELLPARPVSLTEENATTTLSLVNPVNLGQNPPHALSKRALSPSANHVLTNPGPNTRKPSRGKPSTNETSTSEPARPRINWSNDYGTNLVRKWPVLFLPLDSKDRDWDTHVCEVLRQNYPFCKSADAKIELESQGLARHARAGPAYTVVTNIKPLTRGFKPLRIALNAMRPWTRAPIQVYISRDGLMRTSPPEAYPPPDQEERYRKSLQAAREKLKLIRDNRMYSWDERTHAHDQLEQWEETEDLRQRERDIWWARQRWRDPRSREKWKEPEFEVGASGTSP